MHTREQNGSKYPQKVKQQIKGGIIVKRNRTKRILSMLLTLCMVLTLVPMTAFAANAPTDIVIINGVSLNSTYPYLVSGARAASGSLNGTTCTARFDAVHGYLYLWNYNGKEITTSSGGAKDLAVWLKGSNTITGDLKNLTDGGNLIIIADGVASLNITSSRNLDTSLTGIGTYTGGTTYGGGSISIKGKANITISVTNTSTHVYARSYGLFAKQGISISGSASLDITSTCHSSSDYSAYGIYAGNQSFTVNTSGVIRVDVSNTQNAKPIAIEAYSYSLTKVNQLLCKYNSTGCDFFAGFTPPAGFAYNKGVVSGTPTTEIRGGSTPVRTATFVGVRNNFGKWTGQYFSGDSVGLSAEIFGIPFSSWQSSAGSFSSTISSITTFTMPNEDVTITARYNAFNYHPYFTKTESGKGTIIFNLHALPDSAPRLVTKTGDETNIVGNKYFYGDNLPRELTITDGTTSYNVPAGEYRVAVKIGYLWHFSEVFTVIYDAPVTTYAVTVTGGTGGGNYAEGDTVTITANAPATGKVFDKWTTSDGVTFGNANSATTTFTMPAKAVTVKATYKDDPETDTELSDIKVFVSSKSQNGNDSIVKLYSGTLSNAEIRADMNTGAPQNALSFTAIKSNVKYDTQNDNYTQQFSFPVDGAGEYKVAVYKPGYAVKIITAVLTNEDRAVSEEMPLYLLGNPTNTFEITETDYSAVVNYALGSSSETDAYFAADLNRDGVVDVLDAMLVEQYVSGIITDFR